VRIEVLGPGCQKCQLLAKHVEQAIAEAGVKAEVVKVQDMFEIAGRGVNRTPAIIIDDVIKLQGRVATVQEILGWISGQ
jgi:small redox-active disulfide protein 2